MSTMYAASSSANLNGENNVKKQTSWAQFTAVSTVQMKWILDKQYR